MNTDDTRTPIDNEELLVEMTGLAYGGSCIGTVSAGPHAGKRAFVRYTAPGDRVRAAVTKDRGSSFEAELREIVVPGPQRTPPACPYFGTCGGCDLQHLTAGRQRSMKRDFIESTLRFQAGLTPAEGVHLAGADLPDFGYRKRITLHVEQDGRAGFYRAESRSLVDIERCPLAVSGINAALAALKPLFKRHADAIGGAVIEEHADRIFVLLKLRRRVRNAGELAQEFLVHAAGAAVEHEGQELYRTVTAEELQGLPFGRFSQVNECGNAVLIETVMQALRGGAVTELYAGAGNFSIPAAEAGHTVDAVEIDQALIDWGLQRAAERGVAARVRFHRVTAEKYVRQHPIGEALLLDPPRSGARTAVEACRPGAPSAVIYVSCNIATFARDAKILAANGYRLKRVSVIDMFPQTYHAECVGVFDC